MGEGKGKVNTWDVVLTARKHESLLLFIRYLGDVLPVSLRLFFSALYILGCYSMSPRC